MYFESEKAKELVKLEKFHRSLAIVKCKKLSKFPLNKSQSLNKLFILKSKAIQIISFSRIKKIFSLAISYFLLLINYTINVDKIKVKWNNKWRQMLNGVNESGCKGKRAMNGSFAIVGRRCVMNKNMARWKDVKGKCARAKESAARKRAEDASLWYHCAPSSPCLSLCPSRRDYTIDVSPTRKHTQTHIYMLRVGDGRHKYVYGRCASTVVHGCKRRDTHTGAPNKNDMLCATCALS